MLKKFIFAGVIVGIGSFIGGYLFGKKYKAKTYGEAFMEGRDEVLEELKEIYDRGGNLGCYIEGRFGLNK